MHGELIKDRILIIMVPGWVSATCFSLPTQEYTHTYIYAETNMHSHLHAHMHTYMHIYAYTHRVRLLVSLFLYQCRLFQCHFLYLFKIIPSRICL